MVVGETVQKGGKNAALFSRPLHDVQVCCCNFLTKSQYIILFGLIY